MLIYKTNWNTIMNLSLMAATVLIPLAGWVSDKMPEIMFRKVIVHTFYILALCSLNFCIIKFKSWRRMIVWLAIRIKQYKTKQKAVMISIDNMSTHIPETNALANTTLFYGIMKRGSSDTIRQGWFCIYAERLEKADCFFHWGCNLFTPLCISIWLTLFFINTPPPQKIWVAISIKYTWKQYLIVFSNCVRFPTG